MFQLHPDFQDKIFIADLPLSRLLLVDECHYPWLILVPRRAEIRKLIDLSLEDQLELWKESNTIQQFLWKKFQPTQLNVASIGNKTPQLHLHIIARHTSDPAWPGTVWDHPVRKKYSEEQKQEIINVVSEIRSL